MDKPRLLIWSDSPTASTGFGIVAKHLCDELYKHFTLGILGINYFGLTQYDRDKYFLYSVDRSDPIGIQRFAYILDDFKPDIVFLFQDVWNIATLERKHGEKLKPLPKVIYFPVDARPFSKAWKSTLLEANEVITYTEWAKNTILENIPEIRTQVPISTLYHGIDTETFRPIPAETIKGLRKSYNWENKFVITNVNRFQPRKHINQTLRIASLFIKGYKRCSCGNLYPRHYGTCDLNGCSSKEVLSISTGHPKAALYLHMNIHEKTMGSLPSDFLTSHALNYGFTKDDISKCLFFNEHKIYSKDELTRDELNQIYNASNVLLSTSLGEGFGLSTGEALATGTPIIVGKHTANFEVVEDKGYLIENSALMNWGGDSGHTRPIMDPEKALLVLDELYTAFQKDNYEKIPNLEYYEYVKKKFGWKDKADKLVYILKEALDEFKLKKLITEEQTEFKKAGK